MAPLQTPVADARALKRVLVNQQGFLEEEILLIENPVRAELNSFFLRLIQLNPEKTEEIKEAFSIDFEAELDSIPNEWQGFIDKVSLAIPSPSDSLLFYYAGHGIAGDADGEGPAGYFLPTDAIFENVVLKDNQTLVPMEIAFAGIEAINSHHTLLVLDCCFAGAFRHIALTRGNLTLGLRPMSKQRFQRFKDNRAWQVLVSAGPAEKAADLINDKRDFSEIDRDHSPFAKAFLDALSGREDVEVKPSGKNLGDGVLTVHELFLFLHNRVQKLTEEHEDFKAQNPDLFPMRKHDGGQYIFSDPRHPANLDNWPDLKDFNPYAGLKPMDVNNGSFYFGRSRDIAVILDKLQPDEEGFWPTLLLVVGTSGSGKSSLVKAGVLPHFINGEEEYELYQIKPGEFPWCIRQYFPDEGRWERIFEASGEQFRFLKPAVLKEDEEEQDFYFDPTKKQILLIDSFEEFFTELDDDRKQIFEEQLIHLFEFAIRQPLMIIMTMRSDFEWQLELSEFGRLFLMPGADYNPFTKFHRLAGLGLENLREALVHPAIMLAYEFEKDEEGDLVDEILDDLDYVPNALPLLSFTMQAMVDHTDKRERLFEKQVYREVLGGVNGVLSNKMEEIYRSLGPFIPEDEDPADFPLSPEQVMLKKIMMRMVQLNDGAYTRRRVFRPVELDELRYDRNNTVVKKVVDTLVEHQLFIKGGLSYLNPYVELVHDSLINSWTLGKQWINEFGKDQLMLQRQLWQAIIDCKKEGKEYNDDTEAMDIGDNTITKDDASDLGSVSELWENSPKLGQVLGTIVNEEQILKVQEPLNEYYEILKKELSNEEIGDEENGMPALNPTEHPTLKLFRELLDPRIQSETKVNLDAFILSGTSEQVLKIFLEHGDHWLNLEEKYFILDSWKKRIKDILKLKRQRDEAIQAKKEVEEAQDQMVNEIIDASWKSGTMLNKEDVFEENKINGLRVLYEKFKLIIDIPKLKAISRVPIFLEGPHQDEMHFHSKSFGHYNPEFLEWCKKKALPAKNNKLIRQFTRPLYTKFLKEIARTYYLVYHYLSFNESWAGVLIKAYSEEVRIQSEIPAPEIHEEDLNDIPKWRWPDGFGNYFSNLNFQDTDKTYLDLAEQVMDSINDHIPVAVGFWVRRSIDGTAHLFYDLLNDLIDTYDHNWLTWNELTYKRDKNELDEITQRNAITKIWQSYEEEFHAWKPTPGPHADRFGYISFQPFKNLKKWQLLSPVPIYINGPHKDDWQKSEKSFGQYNPEFMDWVLRNAIPARTNNVLIKLTRPFYKNFLRGPALLFFVVMKYYDQRPELKKEMISQLQKFLEDESGVNEFSYYEKIPQADIHRMLQLLGYYINADVFISAPIGFWIRREISGSADSFRELLINLFEVYEPKILEQKYTFD